MTDTINQAKAAVRNWRSNHPDGGAKVSAIPNLKHGDRVIDMGGDGSLLYISGFERNGNEEYHARCLKLGTDKVEVVPVSRLKLSNQNTIH